MKKVTALFLIIVTLCLSGCGSKQVDRHDLSVQKEVIIAVLDTSVSAAAIQSECLLSGWNYVTNTEDTEDRINHGTAVVSVILGCESAGVEAAAPDVSVVPLVIADKVDGEVESVTPDVLSQVIRDSVDKYGASVINVSLGTKKDDPELREAVTYAQEQGTLIIAAAGNEGKSTELYYPAAYEGVLTVGSHDKHFAISDFTQQNGAMDLLAPGEDIWLASRNAKTYGACGTSFAAGYVSAAATLFWQANRNLTAEDVVQADLDCSKTVDGWRILDADAVLE